MYLEEFLCSVLRTVVEGITRWTYLLLSEAAWGSDEKGPRKLGGDA